MNGTEVTLRAVRYLTWAAVALWVVAAFLLTPLAGKTGEVEAGTANRQPSSAISRRRGSSTWTDPAALGLRDIVRLGAQ